MIPPFRTGSSSARARRLARLRPLGACACLRAGRRPKRSRPRRGAGSLARREVVMGTFPRSTWARHPFVFTKSRGRSRETDQTRGRCHRRTPARVELGCAPPGRGGARGARPRRGAAARPLLLSRPAADVDMIASPSAVIRPFPATWVARPGFSARPESMDASEAPTARPAGAPRRAPAPHATAPRATPGARGPATTTRTPAPHRPRQDSDRKKPPATPSAFRIRNGRWRKAGAG
jgi:hypothetical protein